MIIPFKISQLEVRHTKVKYIIIHHTACQYTNPDTKVDNMKFQMTGISSGVLEKKEPDINYHYIIDKIKEDFHVISCRPFVTLCDFPDINQDMNRKSIHVAMMGSYDFKIPHKRLIEVLAYRLLNPFLKIYSINPERILFHSDVSNNKDETCPGLFADKTIITSMTRRFLLK